jgi:hypothetical protein
VIFRPRSPALITTSAVITFVMLPIGRSVFSSRLHSSAPVEAFSTAASWAPTLPGAELDVAARSSADAVTLAPDDGAVRTSPAETVRATAVTRPAARTVR